MAQFERIEHLVVIGVGLIGGSVARALRKAGVVKKITGVGRGRANLEKAQELGVIDAWTHDIGEAVVDADMVLVAVPMGMYETVFAEIAKSLPKDAIITDAGSTKQHAIAVVKRVLPNHLRFVPAHPIAGTEQSGVKASFAELFENRVCILTPTAEVDAEAVEKVNALWAATGSRVIEMDADEHDSLLATVSHLPHLAAFALINAVRKQSREGHDPFQFAAGGFRDFTRIASSSPEMWRDIALSNKDALAEQIDALQSELAEMKKALSESDGELLLQAFSQAKQARDAWLAKHGETL